MKNFTNSTLKHIIKSENFAYDMIKGKLKRGSTISKKVHPIEEVEVLKTSLSKQRKLKDMGSFWSLKVPLSTGILMSRNLHLGRLIKENDLKQEVYVSSAEASQLKDILPTGNLYRTDSWIVKRSERHNYKLNKIFKLSIDESFIQNHGSDNYGKDEEFVLKVLQKNGIISNCARHGNTKEFEADIVDEINGMQFEIIYESKLMPKSKKKVKVKDTLFSPEMQMLRLINNNPFVLLSDALSKKISEKQYSPAYKTCLVILNIGTASTAKETLKKIGDLFYENSEKMHLDDVIVISHDFIDNKTSVIQASTKKYHEDIYKDASFSLVQTEEIKYHQMTQNNSYLMQCKNIFNQKEMLTYGTKEEIEELVKELQIKIIP